MTLPLIPDVPRLEGRRVTVMGLGLFGGGLGITRYLVSAGAKVTVTDTKTAEELREPVAALQGLPVTLRLGGHDERDFQDADLVVANPAVPPSSPWLRLARAVETEMNLFFKLCPAETIVGITGSNGKTTTTTLVGELLKRHLRKTWVGGNIGGSLLQSASEMRPEDFVVLELSSFQLEHLGALRRSPNVGVVLNLSPNHLDRHGDMAGYAAAKREIVAYQKEGDAKVLNADDPLVSAFRSASPSRTWTFGLKEKPSRGAFARDGVIEFHTTGARFTIDVSRRKIPGLFNLQNMAAAATATFVAAGGRWEEWRETCEEVFNSFPGVEHRLEFVAEKKGVKYYNDSKATDAEATIAAIETLPGPFVLILGGFDKKVPFDALARVISEKPVRACLLLGQTAAAIEEALRRQPRVPEIARVSSVEEAARYPARPGETLLLSPACASWGMFRNFEERGRLFKAAVAQLP
jgi:UDP-N-acetylmuramoylalanine--D-glutamate ligase